MEQNNNDEQPQGSPIDDFQPSKAAELKSAQTLATVGIIAGPVSLLFGGVILSTVALIALILAFVKVRRAKDSEDKAGSAAYGIYRQSIVALVVSALALVLNAVSLAFILPSLVEYLQNGSYDDLLNLYGGSAGSSSSADSSSSVWG